MQQWDSSECGSECGSGTAGRAAVGQQGVGQREKSEWRRVCSKETYREVAGSAVVSGATEQK